MITVALKPDRVPVFTIPPEWFPTKYFAFDNFVRTMTQPDRPFGLYMINTLIDLCREPGRDPVLVLGGGLRLCPDAISRPRPPLQGPDPDDADPVAGADGSAVPDLPHDRLVRDLPAVDRAVVLRQRLLRVPDPPVHADHPARARRGGPDRRRRPPRDLLVGHPAADQAGARGLRGLRLPWQLERPPRAADLPRAEQPVHRRPWPRQQRDAARHGLEPGHGSEPPDDGPADRHLLRPSAPAHRRDRVGRASRGDRRARRERVPGSRPWMSDRGPGRRRDGDADRGHGARGHRQPVRLGHGRLGLRAPTTRRCARSSARPCWRRTATPDRTTGPSGGSPTATCSRARFDRSSSSPSFRPRRSWRWATTRAASRPGTWRVRARRCASRRSAS